METKKSQQTDLMAGGVQEGLSEIVYAKLRALANHQMAAENPGITLQPTALVHEAYLRLLRDPAVTWDDDRQFFWAAAQSMRRVLVDAARRRRALKRGGNRSRQYLGEVPAADTQPEPVERLDTALEELKAMDARLYEVVVLRYFAGLTVDMTAQALRVAPRTVKRDWATARNWLRLYLAGGIEGLVHDG
ncbi:MAG: ECF-type sigma factor [Planctomycetota bacterium]